jgi:hypothetical protein
MWGHSSPLNSCAGLLRMLTTSPAPERRRRACSESIPVNPHRLTGRGGPRRCGSTRLPDRQASTPVLPSRQFVDRLDLGHLFHRLWLPEGNAARGQRRHASERDPAGESGRRRIHVDRPAARDRARARDRWNHLRPAGHRRPRLPARCRRDHRAPCRITPIH